MQIKNPYKRIALAVGGAQNLALKQIALVVTLTQTTLKPLQSLSMKCPIFQMAAKP